MENTKKLDMYTEEETKIEEETKTKNNEKYWFASYIATTLRTCKATCALTEYDLIKNCNTTIFNSVELLTKDARYFSEDRLAEIEKTILFAKDYLLRYGEAFIDWTQQNPYIVSDSRDLLLAKQKYESTCPFYKIMREEFAEVQKCFRNLIAYFD